METANEIMKQVVPILMVPINRYLRYLISCTKYVRDMGIKMTELNAAKMAIEEKMRWNISNHLEVPSEVDSWLEDVGNVNAKVENVPRDVGGCFNLKIRYRMGRNAFEINEEIDSMMRRYKLISFTDHLIPPGKVDSMNASTSTPSTKQNEFQSREMTFTEALKALELEHKSHMIALCGMGGVGKTTMMQRLKKVAKEKKMFKFIVEVVIGEKTDPIAIQEAIAYYLGVQLNEKTKPVRADKLRQGFMAKSDGGKNKFLVILDDVWQPVDLEDIGLSPLANQGIDFKVLLTSRNKDVCAEMGVESNSIFNVKILTEAEAQSLFCQFVKDTDPELHKIGKDIVRKCCGLPIAIKTMACTLRTKSKDAWKDALSRLEYHDIGNVASKVFETSYDNLQDEETKSIFLLCGLFPEDFDIPTEELVRYGWGLKLFNKVFNIREARIRLNTCIERLVHTNLLMEVDDVMCIKMHDLVRAFVLDMLSKVECALNLNQGDTLEWFVDDMRNSCKRLSLTCKNMSEFPRDFKFPNLTILKLMHGDKSLRFPLDFYEEMGKLHVISYDKMKYPLLPSSHQCSTNLRVLHLQECSLKMFDFSSIGNLFNMEVLSFANSDIELLPSTIGNLKKLRLLDLTNCYGLHIDNDVLINLVKLEELYMKVFNGRYRKTISMTDENYNEMVVRSCNLSALEFEFFPNVAQIKNMSFHKLERFKISMGRFFDEDFIEKRYSYENTLKLVIGKGELQELRMNELFEKTGVLCLSVGDMHDLEDVEVKSLHPPQSSSYYNLKVLIISKSPKLRYLFTLRVANTLSKLEHLEVYECNNMEELIYTGGSGEATITFSKLKFLSLRGLPKLLGLCHNVNIIELPQLTQLKLGDIPGFTSIYPENKLETTSLLNEHVVMPKLDELYIDAMENLKEIWPYESSASKKVKLRGIRVSNCKNLVNLFPCNPIPLLHHLEVLIVEECGSIKVLFNIDWDCVGETGESDNGLKFIMVIGCDSLVNLFPCNPMSLLRHLEDLIVKNCASIEVLFNIDLDSIGVIGKGSSLRSIQVVQLGKLSEVWRIKGAYKFGLRIPSFQDVKSIKIEKCKRFRNVLFTPTTIDLDLEALMDISIEKCGENRRNLELAESSQEQPQKDTIPKEETTQVSGEIFNVVFPFRLIHCVHSLRKLKLSNFEGMEVVFEIESSTSRELATTDHNQQRLLPNLEELNLSYMDNMTHVWKCNWNKFLILQKQQSNSPFYNLTTIHMFQCISLKYLFSPLMAKLLYNIKKVEIRHCYDIEEVVSSKDDEDEEMASSTYTSSHKSTSLFPHLETLTLTLLRNLKCIGGGGSNGPNKATSLCNSTTTTNFVDQFKFSEAGGVSWTLGQYSREIEVWGCDALSTVIPYYAAGKMQKLQKLKINYCDGMKEVFETNNAPGIPRLDNVIVLSNLKTLEIANCACLEYIFTFFTLKSLGNLEELTIWYCEALKVIVKEEKGGVQTTMASKEVVLFPRLKSIALINLPELVGFFLGKNELQWPLLDKVIIRNCPQMMAFALGGSIAPQLKYIHTSLGKHSLECGLNFHMNHQTPFPSSCPPTSEGMPWSFYNLIEIHIIFYDVVEKIIPSKELLQLQQLEKIHVSCCSSIEEIFEALEGTNSSVVESQTTIVKVPNLREVELSVVNGLRYIWKSNQWTVFQFPNLTRVKISSCNKLEHVFTSSMVGSLLQLQELHIYDCENMEEIIVEDANVIVHAEEKEESDEKKKEIMLPRLKSLRFEQLPCLKAFWLGKVDFSFPLLDTLIIKKCPAITIFTGGKLTSPELKEIETIYCSLYVGGDINSVIKIKQEEFKRDGPLWM